MNQAKYRKKADDKVEIDSIFNEIKQKKTPVTLWQTLPNDFKNLKGAYVTSISRNTNIFTLSPLDGVFFDFIPQIPIFMFCGIKGFFAKTTLQFCSKMNISMVIPPYDEIKLTEGRGHCRFKISNDEFLTSFFYQGKPFEFENFDISQGGLGLILPAKERWTFQIKKNVDIITVGPSLGEITCPRKAEVAHISEIVVRDDGPTRSVIILGLKFIENLSETDFITYVEKLSIPPASRSKKKAA
jgi:hypothetical protein